MVKISLLPQEAPNTSSVIPGVKSSNTRGFLVSALLALLFANFSNPYRFSVLRTAAAATGNNAFAKISFDTELIDSNGNFTGGSYTVTVNGDYEFDARFSVTTTTTNSTIIISLYKNGVEVYRGDRNVIPTSGAIASASLSSPPITLVAGDVMDIYAFGSNAALSFEVGSNATGPSFSGKIVSI